MRLIKENPLHYAIKKGLREAKTDTFPYLLVYKIREKEQVIDVLSVFHTSRNPRRKRQ